MRITHLDEAPAQGVSYLNAASGGGRHVAHLPITLGRAEGLPDDVDAVLCASDLQGRGIAPPEGGESPLLGETLAETVEALGEAGLWPFAERIGVILAGDLYGSPLADVRGATGDVRSVWRAFGRRFRWVVGVAGNHDTFGTDDQRVKLLDAPNLHLLDGGAVTLGGVPFGGVSYISATRHLHKPGRRTLEAQLARIDEVTRQDLGALILHEGPEGAGTHRVVPPELEEATLGVPLVICGHNPTPAALWEADGRQVLNVHERAILLLKA